MAIPGLNEETYSNHGNLNAEPWDTKFVETITHVNLTPILHFYQHLFDGIIYTIVDLYP